MTTAAITAFAASLVFVPLMRRLAQRIGWVSAPRSDRWSRKPVALCGGLAIFAAFLLSALSARPPGAVWAGLLGPAAAMCLLGWADDILGFKPYTKFVGQVIIASAAVYAGSAFQVFPWVPLNIIASVFWIVAGTNAFNLLDNMDGLSAGIGIIAAGFLAALLLQEGRSEAAVLAAALVTLDLLDGPPGKEKPIKTDAETLSGLPGQFLAAVLKAINEDMRPDPTEPRAAD